MKHELKAKKLKEMIDKNILIVINMQIMIKLILLKNQLKIIIQSWIMKKRRNKNL
jgi:hypothetical protein